MRITILLMCVLPLGAQEPAKPVAAEAKPAAAEPKPAETPSPVPAADSNFTGWIEVGGRVSTGVAGSFDTYRSFVNLGEGPKLLGAEFTLINPKGRAFDTIRVRSSSWGDEPYSTFHLDARKARRYEFNADYRDLAYFNFLPSYADPLLARGIVLNEQSFDTHRRLSSYSLDLLPGNWIIPYVAYSRDSGSGSGAAVFVADGNEYAVPNRLRDRTNLFRGGVRLELRRFHATLEQGGTNFEDNQTLFTSGNTKNFGNVSNTVFGQTLFVNTALAFYGIHGSSKFSKGLFTANPLPWLDVYGQFLFSQPESEVSYEQTAAGNLFSQRQILFFSSQQYVVASAAKLPHTSASFGFEVRPWKRMRILESWLTDRLHNAGSSVSNLSSTGATGTQQTAAVLASSLATDYSQTETNVIFDATRKLTLRGGFRYVWGESRDVVLPAAGLSALDETSLSRKVGIGGATFRMNAKLSFSGDSEIARSSEAYFRTSLFNYEKIRARARYQATGSISLAADFSALNNQNPTPGIRYDFLSTQESLSLLWSPKGGKRLDAQASYTRSDFRSDLTYLSPQDLRTQRSLYRENAHTGTALVNLNLPKLKLPRYPEAQPKLTAGGSFFVSSGSRPTRYYQPVAKLWLPVAKRAALFAEWRYYGYGEAFYLYEAFRTHLFTAGLRLTR
ncbi:MAG TPA: hypothetical protein VGP79_01430 [Bryobacteraceae bacterium]|nr:hypothetical protein [Bryobacteraceae bacterium]